MARATREFRTDGIRHTATPGPIRNRDECRLQHDSTSRWPSTSGRIEANEPLNEDELIAEFSTWPIAARCLGVISALDGFLTSRAGGRTPDDTATG
jgi:hypothetical protein